MRSFDDWMRETNPWRVIEAAAHDERARDAAVSRIIDTMLEVQLDYSRVSPGWPPISSTSLACDAMRGELLGGGYGGGDPMLLAYGRAWKESPWHCACDYLLRILPSQPAAAMLMQAARVRPMKQRVGNWWCKTAAQLLEHQDEAFQRLQLKGQGIVPFQSVRTWQLHARAARTILRKWLEKDEVKYIYLNSQKSIDHAEIVGLS